MTCLKLVFRMTYQARLESDLMPCQSMPLRDGDGFGVPPPFLSELSESSYGGIVDFMRHWRWAGTIRSPSGFCCWYRVGCNRRTRGDGEGRHCRGRSRSALADLGIGIVEWSGMVLDWESIEFPWSVHVSSQLLLELRRLMLNLKKPTCWGSKLHPVLARSASCPELPQAVETLTSVTSLPTGEHPCQPLPSRGPWRLHPLTTCTLRHRAEHFKTELRGFVSVCVDNKNQSLPR